MPHSRFEVEATDRLARIETKVDNLLASHAVIEPRITSLESWRTKVVGYAAGVSAAVTLGFHALGKLIPSWGHS